MKIKLHQSLKDKNNTTVEHLKKSINYYARGAINLDELIYNIAHSEEELNFKELAALFIDILENYSFTEQKNVKKELIRIIMEGL